MNKLQKGPLPPPATEDSTPFWKFIDTWGGSWMWPNINTGDKPKDNMQRVADGMTAGTLIWTTNGSYDRKSAADLSGVGWTIFCKATSCQITGSFWERSITASSFRAEMLGLCALHLLARAIAEYYGLGRWLAKVCCNNKQALLLSSHHKGQMWPSAKMRWYQKELSSYQTNIPGGIQVHARVWTHGPTPIVVTPQYHTTAKLCMQHASKTCSDNGHYRRLPQRPSSNSSTRVRCAHSLGQQSHRQHLWPTTFPRKQGGCP
jgi:hypothetical protein